MYIKKEHNLKIVYVDTFSLMFYNVFYATYKKDTISILSEKVSNPNCYNCEQIEPGMNITLKLNSIFTIKYYIENMEDTIYYSSPISGDKLVLNYKPILDVKKPFRLFISYQTPQIKGVYLLKP